MTFHPRRAPIGPGELGPDRRNEFWETGSATKIAVSENPVYRAWATHIPGAKLFATGLAALSHDESNLPEPKASPPMAPKWYFALRSP
jgi:hypothetical protein